MNPNSADMSLSNYVQIDEDLSFQMSFFLKSSANQEAAKMQAIKFKTGLFFFFATIFLGLSTLSTRNFEVPRDLIPDMKAQISLVWT